MDWRPRRSTARAIEALPFLVDRRVSSERIGVAGYADLRPIEPNDSPANRRVEFVFIREAAADEEPLIASVEEAEDLEAATVGPDPDQSVAAAGL